MKRIFLLIIACFSLIGTHAAYLKDVPKTLTQPDGSVLHCYASGDEFFNYLHDANGFTIMQHPQTGFYVYADKRDGKLVATEFVAGSVDPASKNLKPFNLISPEEWMARRKAWQEKETLVNRDLPNHGTLNNISIFIRFSDDEQFTNTYSSIDNMFNDESTNAVSLKTYFRAASYGAIEIPTYFYPGHNGETIISYQDTYPRSYFQPYNASTNTNGYQTEDESRDREFSLLQRAVNYINTNYPVPISLNIDYDNDGLVDNVCFIVRGDVGEWSSLLWPHKWSLYDRTVRINGKRVWTFNFQLADASSYFNTSVMCHEMNHSLGAPDLYHYYNGTNISPVGSWDLMENNATPPQHCGAYMKMKYGHWIDEIPEITQPGTYTLNPISSATPTNIAYKIQSDDPDQYYVLEYRDNTSLFETALPGAGLLIYRIDTRFDGNAGYDPNNGVYDEVYLFRPNGSTSNNGSLYSAHFSANVGRTEFSASTSAYPFFTDGTTDNNFRIYDITSAGSTISFSYGNSSLCGPPTNLIASVGDNDVSLSWDAVTDARSYNIYRNGSLIGNTIGTTYFDNNLAVGNYSYYLKSVDPDGLMSSASETVSATILSEGSVIIGDGGTTTSVYLPSYSYYSYSLTQQIYTPDEIGEPGYITSIAFFNGGAEKTRTYDFYLKTTTKNTFASNTDWEAVTDADKVFSGSVTMAVGTWTTINFDTPFVYDGTSNLILVADDNSGEWTSSPHMGCRTFSASSQALRIYSDGTNYDPLAPNYTGTILSVKNQIIFQKVTNKMQVHADYYPDTSDPNSPYVKVHWGRGVDNVEDFERGDFSMFPWNLDATYPWSITDNQAYEGNYCMKSSNEGVHNSTSSMECIMQVPNDGQISFFSKISSESSWDFGYFYIDGVQMSSYSGNGSWGERTFAVTAGLHTFKWAYTKDGSVNRNDDCFYVDYIRFYTSNGFAYDFDDSRLPVGWTTIDADGDGYNWMMGSDAMSTGYGHNGSNDMILSQSYDFTAGALYPDNYLVSEQVNITSGSHFTFWACAQDANWAAEHFGVFVSLGSNSNPADFQEVQSWTMTAKGGGRPTEGKASRGGGTRVQGVWYYYDIDLSAYAGLGYIAIRHYDCSDMFYFNIDDVAFGNPSKSGGTTYRIYRAHCDGSGMQLIADNVTGNEYIDTEWTALAPGDYMYGVKAVSNGRESTVNWAASGNGNTQQQPLTREAAEAMGIELCPTAFGGTPNPMDGERGNRSTWNLLGSYSCSSAYQYGVATDGMNIYHSAWSSSAGFQFAKYDMEGNLIETFEIDDCGYLRDLTYDGQYFYGGSAGDVLYCVDLANKQLISSTSTECSAIRYCAYDPVRDGFWVGNWDTSIQCIARDGTTLVTGPNGINFSGAAYYKDKNNVEHIYMFAQPASNAVIYDYHIASNTISSSPIFSVSDNLADATGSSGGCFIGEAFGKTALFTAIQQSPNFVGIFELTNGQEAWSNCIEKPLNSQQTIALNQGTNWVSFNVEITLDDLKAALVEAMPGATNIRISSQNSTTTWNGRTWRGDIPWDVMSMYIIQAPTACEITLVNLPINPAEHPITISQGANWIAFPLNESMTLLNAFSGFAVNGDKVSSQTSSSSYNGSTWRGGVSSLESGKGYVYQSSMAGTRTFTFPTGAK